MRWQLWTTWLLNFRNWATSWETSADIRSRFLDRKTIMTCFFCQSFCWWNGYNSNATTLSINTFLYSAVLVVSFLQSSGCFLRFLSALPVSQSSMFWFLRPRFSGNSLWNFTLLHRLVFIRQLLRISSAWLHHTQVPDLCGTAHRCWGAGEAPGQEGDGQARSRGGSWAQPLTLTSEAGSQSEGASVCHWPIRGALRLACQWWEA